MVKFCMNIMEHYDFEVEIPCQTYCKHDLQKASTKIILNG